MIQEYEILKGEIDELDDKKKVLTDAAKRREAEIIAEMLDVADAAGLPIGSLQLEVNHRRYAVSSKQYYAIRAADRAEGFAALRAAGLGDLITERVDDRTLTNVLRDEMERNGGEVPEAWQGIPLATYEKTLLSSQATGRKGA